MREKQLKCCTGGGGQEGVCISIIARVCINIGVFIGQSFLYAFHWGAGAGAGSCLQ